MIQPITYRINTASFKNQNTVTDVTQPTTQVEITAQDPIFDYTEIKENESKYNKNLWLPIGGVILLCGVSALAFPTVRKKLFKAGEKNRDKFNEFISISSEKEIPTLDTCKSIDKGLKEFLQNQIEYANASPEEIKHTGMPKSSNRLILYGPPGTGKTFFAKIFAKTLGAEYTEVLFSEFISRWVGVGVEKMTAKFEKIIAQASKNPDKKYVVVFNEIDTMVQPIEKLSATTVYGGGALSKISERATLLNYLDIFKEKTPNVCIIGTTNLSPENNGLDRATLSRFKNIKRVAYPDKTCLMEALKANISDVFDIKNITESCDEKLKKYVKEMFDRKSSYRDLDDIVDNSKNYYLRDYRKDKTAKYKLEYLEKAIQNLNVTDGEMGKVI